MYLNKLNKNINRNNWFCFALFVLHCHVREVPIKPMNIDLELIVYIVLHRESFRCDYEYDTRDLCLNSLFNTSYSSDYPF